MTGFQTHKRIAGVESIQGKSAFQTWIDQGNTGSEADFLQSLQGAPGASQISADSGNRIESRADGLFVERVAEGQLADMTIIFENALL